MTTAPTTATINGQTAREIAQQAIDSAFYVSPRAALHLIILLLLVWGLIRVVNGSKIEWWHFISSRDAQGNIYGDPEKLGVLVAIVAGTFIVITLAYRDRLDSLYGWLIYGTWLLFISGVGSFASWARRLLSEKYGGATPLPGMVTGDVNGGAAKPGG